MKWICRQRVKGIPGLCRREEIEGISLESGGGKEADIMCNLSEWIEEDALKRGQFFGAGMGSPSD